VRLHHCALADKARKSLNIANRADFGLIERLA